LKIRSMKSIQTKKPTMTLQVMIPVRDRQARRKGSEWNWELIIIVDLKKLMTY